MNYSCFARHDLRHNFSKRLLVFKANVNGVFDLGAVMLELAFVWLGWNSGIRVKGFRDSARTGECVVSSGTVLFGDQNQPGISFQILYYLKRHRVRVFLVIRWRKRREEAQAREEGCVMLICGSIILSDNYRLSFPAAVAPRACVCVCVCGRFNGLRCDKWADTMLRTIFIR